MHLPTFLTLELGSLRGHNIAGNIHTLALGVGILQNRGTVSVGTDHDDRVPLLRTDLTELLQQTVHLLAQFHGVLVLSLAGLLMRAGDDGGDLVVVTTLHGSLHKMTSRSHVVHDGLLCLLLARGLMNAHRVIARNLLITRSVQQELDVRVTALLRHAQLPTHHPSRVPLLLAVGAEDLHVGGFNGERRVHHGTDNIVVVLHHGGDMNGGLGRALLHIRQYNHRHHEHQLALQLFQLFGLLRGGVAAEEGVHQHGAGAHTRVEQQHVL